MGNIYCLITVLIIHYCIFFMEKVQKSFKNFSILSQDAQLIWLMNNESDNIINLFSRYIYDCFKFRDDFTYIDHHL